MKKNKHFRMLSMVLITAYILSACSGALPQDISPTDAISTLSAIASSTPDLPEAGDDDELEIFGIVEAITEDTITINDVVYGLADFTEFKDPIEVGNQVKIHVIVNADGTLTIREIEISAGDDNDNDANDNDANDNDANDNDANDNDANDNDANDNGNDNDSSGPGSGGGNDNGGNDNG